MREKITIYSPDRLRTAGMAIWADMFLELSDSRGLIWRLIIRDISAKYKQSALGIIWTFVLPFIMTAVFVVARKWSVLPVKETNMPYPVFVFVGQMVWLLFSQAMMLSSNSLISSGSLLTKIYFPREVLVFAALGQAVFEFLIRIPLLLLLMYWIGYIPKWTIWVVPLYLLPMLFLIAGIGFIVAIGNAFLRDVNSVLTIVVNLGMFVTPVIYPPPESWPISLWVNYVNPVSAYISSFRDLIEVGYVTNIVGFKIAAIVGLFIFLVGWRIFHLVEPKLSERI